MSDKIFSTRESAHEYDADDKESLRDEYVSMTKGKKLLEQDKANDQHLKELYAERKRTKERLAELDENIKGAESFYSRTIAKYDKELQLLSEEFYLFDDGESKQDFLDLNLTFRDSKKFVIKDKETILDYLAKIEELGKGVRTLDKRWLRKLAETGLLLGGYAWERNRRLTVAVPGDALDSIEDVIRKANKLQGYDYERK